MGTIFKRLQSEGVLLAAVPLIGSLMAFAYETGYLTYFDVPVDVIDLSLYRILTAILWLSVALAVVWALGARVAAIALSPNNVLKNVFGVILLIALIVIIIWNFQLRREAIFVLLGSLVVPFLGLASWVISEAGPIGKRLPEELAAAVRDGQDIARKAGTFSDLYVGPISVMLLSLGLVGVLGYWTAKVGNKFWILKDEPNFFLVRKYGDVFVFKDYDPKTMKMGTQVQVLTLSDATMILESVSLPGLSTNFANSEVGRPAESSRRPSR